MVQVDGVGDPAGEATTVAEGPCTTSLEARVGAGNSAPAGPRAITSSGADQEPAPEPAAAPVLAKKLAQNDCCSWDGGSPAVEMGSLALPAVTVMEGHIALPATHCSQPVPAHGVAQSLDLEAWRGDLQRLHGTIDQVVQAFIASQTRQLDAVAAELSSQRERIISKERCFTELSDSIATFVEEEAKRLEFWGLPLGDPEADARHESYDAQLPGPPALHRMNRLWRKATRAFEAMRGAKEQEAAAALEELKHRHEGELQEAEQRCNAQRVAHESELAALKATLDEARGNSDAKEGTAKALSAQVEELTSSLAAAKEDLARTAEKFGQMELAQSRAEYEWGAEREELTRERETSQKIVADLEKIVAEAGQRESDLTQKCSERGEKLEQMRRLMDEQERELNAKIERVQQYVKERQTGALHAEKKQQDAEKMAERWQSEVRRLQAERDRLANLVLDLESRQNGQAKEFHGAWEQRQNEVVALQEALRKKEEEMRAANLELLQKRDDEYQAKVGLERQREKERSIALLKRKDQELHIKDQQLKAARQRLQELDTGSTAAPGCAAASPSSRGSSAPRKSSESVLPPLPLSAR